MNPPKILLFFIAALTLVACGSDATGPSDRPADLSQYSGEWEVKATYWFSGTSRIGLDGEVIEKPGTAVVVTGLLDVDAFRDVRQETDLDGTIVTHGVTSAMAQVLGGRTCKHTETLAPIDCKEGFQLQDWSNPWVGIEVTESPAGELETVLRINLGRNPAWDARLHQAGPGLFVSRPGVEHPDSLGWMLRRPS